MNPTPNPTPHPTPNPTPHPTAVGIGADNSPLGDLWRYSIGSHRWQQLGPVANLRPWPIQRSGATLASLPHLGLLVLQGGEGPKEAPVEDDDMWLWSPTQRSWTRAFLPGEVPGGRRGALFLVSAAAALQAGSAAAGGGKQSGGKQSGGAWLLGGRRIPSLQEGDDEGGRVESNRTASRPMATWRFEWGRFHVCARGQDPSPSP